VIAGSLATPALLAQVLVSKYRDHTLLYRQSQIFTRHGRRTTPRDDRVMSAQDASTMIRRSDKHFFCMSASRKYVTIVTRFFHRQH
jgi:transposase